MSHRWRLLDIAEKADWSTLAYAGGETSGPGVSIEQCEHCGAVRVTSEGNEEPTMFGVRGDLKLREPECEA